MNMVGSNLRLALTPEGIGWLLVSLVAFLLATNYNNNVVFMLACLLLGVWLLAAWLTLKNLSGLTCKQWRIEPCFAGGDSDFQLLLEAAEGREHVELGCKVVGQKDKQKTRLMQLNSGERQWLTLTLTMEKRGWFVPKAASVVSSWPFGLWCASMEAPEVPSCLVYPKPNGTQSLPDTHQLDADEQSLDDLSGVRAYQTGDNTRRMDWKSMARTDQILIKTFEGHERQKTTWLNDKNVRVSTFEEKIEQLTRWVVECDALGAHYGIRIGAETLLPGSGREHHVEGLRLLALAKQER